MADINHYYGLKPPEHTKSWWSARLIYDNPGFVDRVHDRQTFGSEYSTDLEKWFQQRGWQMLRAGILQHYNPQSSSEQEWALQDGRFHARANPRRSYGYIYVVVWEDPI